MMSEARRSLEGVNLHTALKHARYPLLLAAGCGLAFLQISYETFRGGAIESRTYGVALMAGAVSLAGLAVLAGIAAIRSSQAVRSSRDRPASPGSFWIVPTIWIALAAGYLFLIFGPVAAVFELWAVRVVVFILVVSVADTAAERWGAPLASDRMVGAYAVLLGLLHTVLTYVPLVSTFPLALGWSETSRYYYGSLFLDQQIYGQDLAPSVLHPTRYLLQAIPFLVERNAIWVHRLWQVLLWLGLTAGAAVVLSRRVFEGRRARSLLLAGWATLFLFQGPIIYHLLIPVLLILGLTDSRRPWRTSAVVLIASLWAGVSRINWIPVPAMLAIAIFMLERPATDQNWLPYLRWPAVWGVLGVLAGVASHTAYVRFSGIEPYLFGSSLTSDLLWYRMLPNRTFIPGMLLAAALASLPVAIVLWATRDKWSQFHWLRWASVGAMLAVLLVGGLVVSMKIGGGSNLHNLDAYLVLLLIVGGYLYAGRAVAPDSSALSSPSLSWGQAAASIAIPIAFALGAGGPLRWPAPEVGQAIVDDIERRIENLDDPNPSVLFIGERHLLTFGRIEGVELIPEHEKVFLMEMAMSQNDEYLSRFHTALMNREYDMIISEPLRVQFQGRGHAFGEENDAWVRQVSIPILCDYRVVYEAEAAAVQILVPKEGGQDCPDR